MTPSQIRWRRSLSSILLFGALASGSLHAQATTKTRILGVWAHPGFFGTDETEARAKIRTTLDAYIKSGIDTVIMLVKGTNGYVYYDSRIGVRDPAYRWDFFGVFLNEARQRRISVHAWFCVFPEGGLFGQVREHPDWLIRSPENELLGVANPALPEARAYERNLMIELVKRYAVDWVHLDYIRFPSSPREVYFSWDARTRALFKDLTGIDPMDMKARDSGNPMWNEWIEWNAGHVTAFVRELKDSLRALGRPVKISAAVFPSADEAKVLVAQDWRAWVKGGLVDMLCPMIYINDVRIFETFARRAVEIGAGSCLVCPGIGIGTSHNQNTPDIMNREIGIARTLAADGVVFFSSSSLNADFLKKLEESRPVSK